MRYSLSRKFTLPLEASQRTVKGEEFLRIVKNPFAKGCLLLTGSDWSGLREMCIEKEGQRR